MTLSVLETVRSCFITTVRSFLVVSAFMMGGWITAVSYTHLFHNDFLFAGGFHQYFGGAVIVGLQLHKVKRILLAEINTWLLYTSRCV